MKKREAKFCYCDPVPSLYADGTCSKCRKKQIKILLVAGSRSVGHFWWDAVCTAIIDLKPDLILHGGAAGVDSIANEVAKLHGIPCHITRPNYERYGKDYAPIARNKVLSSMCTEALVIYKGERTNGTSSTEEAVINLGKRITAVNLETGYKSTYSQPNIFRQMSK